MGASNVTARREDSGPEVTWLLEAMVERENMLAALRRVEANKGAAGCDGMAVEELRAYLIEEWPRVKEELLSGEYEPAPVRVVEIPKPGGKGVRKLGIPTVLDRLLQQALNQVLNPIFEGGFSESSYGFRRGRSAQEAVMQAREFVSEGRRWVVNIDLENFFDRVNHDVLMSRVARKVKDKRVLRLIRKYLQAGIMAGGVVSARSEGVPQGSPLSPLLSNVLLDELDKELERRGHAFCRYADDCNVYVKSKVAGERVLSSITRFLERKLRLRVNREKSSVTRSWKMAFLGYSMTAGRRPRLRVARSSVKRLKKKLRAAFRKGKGRNLLEFISELAPMLRGWMNYFKHAEVKRVFEELDGWIRRKLRCVIWRQWKRRPTRARYLIKRGLSKERARQSAGNGRGPWWNAGASHMNIAFPKSFFDRHGLVSLCSYHYRFQATS
jgi:RNA-directed DNA polymerase